MSAFAALPSTTAAGLLETRNTLYPPPPPRGQKRACSRRWVRRSSGELPRPGGSLERGEVVLPARCQWKSRALRGSPRQRSGLSNPPDGKPYQKPSSALDLAFGKGEEEPRSSGESRACSCAAAHSELAPAAGRAPEQPFRGNAGLTGDSGTDTRPVTAANLPPRGPSAPAGRARGHDPGRDAFPPSALSLVRENSEKKNPKRKTRVRLHGRYNHLHTLSRPFVGHSWNLSVNALTFFPDLTYFCISSKVRAEVEFTEQKQEENNPLEETFLCPQFDS